VTYDYTKRECRVLPVTAASECTADALSTRQATCEDDAAVDALWHMYWGPIPTIENG